MSTILKLIDGGHVIVIGHRLYARCSKCGSIIRINKPLFGSLHFCTREEAEDLTRQRR